MFAFYLKELKWFRCFLVASCKLTSGFRWSHSVTCAISLVAVLDPARLRNSANKIPLCIITELVCGSETIPISLSEQKRGALVHRGIIPHHSCVINTLCNLYPVLQKRYPKYGPLGTRGPTSGHLGREIDCFHGSNSECVEAIVLLQIVIFLVEIEEVLDDLLAVEDVDFSVYGFDLWTDGIDLWTDGGNVCADRDHGSVLVVQSVIDSDNFV